MAIDTNTIIPQFSTTIIDPRTGSIDPLWYQFLLQIFNRTELTINAVTDVLGAAPIVSSGTTTPTISISPATVLTPGSLSAADKTKLDSVTSGASVANVTGTAPITSTGGNAPAIGITPATGLAAGSMSSSDKIKIDTVTAGAAVASVAGTTPIVSSGGTAPVISISPATGAAAGSMSAVDKAKLDLLVYATGTWTPVLTCATPGNLAVTYAIQSGTYTQIGRQVFLNFTISTSAFTWTTATGAVSITGLPVVSNVPTEIVGTVDYSGITIAGYQHIVPAIVQGASNIVLRANASGQPRTSIDISFMPSGGTVFLSGHITYFV